LLDTRVLPAGPSPPATPAIVIDQPAQRNPRVWDEVTGQSWRGADDLSATVTATWDDQALTMQFEVRDDTPLPVDSVELFLAPVAGEPLHVSLAPPVAATPAPLFAVAAEPLIGNGQFTAALAGWNVPNPAGAAVVTEHGNSFVRLTGSAIVQRDIPLNPSWGKLRIGVHARYTDIVPGAKSWHRGRVNLDFKDAKGKHVGDWPRMIDYLGTRADWQHDEETYDIPAGATKLRLQLGMWEVQSGTLDLDNIVLEPVADRAGQPIAPLGMDGITATGQRTPAGFTATVVIAWRRCGKSAPQAGQRIGLNVLLSDSDAPSATAPHTQLAWAGAATGNPAEAAAHGCLLLLP
jgi:hypothetical protein